MTSPKSFPELIEGKTVAIVGPAVSVGDQSNEVEASDFVIVTDYRWNNKPSLTGYGSKIDATFLSVFGSHEIAKNPENLDGIEWVILKAGGKKPNHPRVLQSENPLANPNQIPVILHFLEPLKPAAIHIFGADFYVGGPTNSYQEQYNPGYDLDYQWKSVSTHDQSIQHAWVKQFQERTGLIKGDSRMVELLSISTDELMNRLRDAWRSVSG